MKLFFFKDFQNRFHLAFCEVVTDYYNLNTDTLYLGEKGRYTFYWAFDHIIALLKLE